MLEKDLNNEEKLEAIYQMTLDNHEVLLAIRRQQYMSSFFSILYWLVVLGALGSAYYFVKPFIPSVISNLGKVEETVNQLNQVKGQINSTNLFNEVMKDVNKQTTPTKQAPTQ